MRFWGTLRPRIGYISVDEAFRPLAPYNGFLPQIAQLVMKRERGLAVQVPPFDFSVPGVTSMSVDTHKFGQAHKGTSVVLYSSPALRRHQYTTITEWSGGLYISPGMAGSRSGALIATAWAALVHHGEAGYMAATAAIMKVGPQHSSLQPHEKSASMQPSTQLIATSPCNKMRCNTGGG